MSCSSKFGCVGVSQLLEGHRDGDRVAPGPKAGVVVSLNVECVLAAWLEALADVPARAGEACLRSLLWWERVVRHSALLVDCPDPRWAIPGGMVDAGESVSLTLKREFTEEAGALTDQSEKAIFTQLTEELFSNGLPIYTGYVDDPRNTDNAWLETT